MKLTRIQIGACIFLAILILILCGCYLFYPTTKSAKTTTNMPETKLNEYLTIKTMTKEQMKNNDFYSYIKSYKKDMMKWNGIDEKELTSFQREISLTELEITSALSSAKMAQKKNSVEVTRTVTSTTNKNHLIVTVYYKLNDQAARNIQLFINLDDLSVIKTQTMLSIENKEVSLFTNNILDDFISQIKGDVVLVEKENEDQKIETETLTKNRSSFVKLLQNNIDSYQYTILDGKFSIYYSYDQIAEQLGYKIRGLDHSSELKTFSY